MEKNSFTLRGQAEQQAQRPQRASTAGSLIPGLSRQFTALVPDRPRTFTAGPLMQVQQAWTPRPHRGFINVDEQTTTRPDPDTLAKRPCLDDPPAHLREDKRMHRSSSSPRFDAPRIASREGQDIERDQQASIDHSPLDSNANTSSDGTANVESGSDGENKEDSQCSDGTPSFWSTHEVVDSIWGIRDLPEKIQRTVDKLIEYIMDRQRKLSEAKTTARRLSRDNKALKKEVDTLNAKREEHELQLSEQGDALQDEREKGNNLQEELTKLRGESQKEKYNLEKSQQNMKTELDKFLKSLTEANEHLQLKDKELDRVHRDVVRAEQEISVEVSRRENAETESQVFKRDLFDLRKRSNKEKREWLARQERNEEGLMKLEDENEKFKEQVSWLEDTVKKLSASNQDLEEDLHDILSFLGRTCHVVHQLYQTVCIRSHRGFPGAVAFPHSACLTVGEDSDDYRILGQLFEKLKASLSPTSVLEIASPYQEALRSFFKTLALRDVVCSHFVCFHDDAFERMKISLSEQRVQHMAVREALNMHKKDLISCTKDLMEHKKELSTNIEEFKQRLSKDASEKSNLSSELEKANVTIENLRTAASVSTKKQTEVEASLRNEINYLGSLSSQKEAQLKVLSESEATLRKAKEELEHSSRQLIADATENKRRTEALTIEREKFKKEKDDALKMVDDSEHAVQQMSEKVTEAFAMRQSALEDLILEKNKTEELRSKLPKVSEACSEVPTEKTGLQAMMPDMQGGDTLSCQRNNGSDKEDFCDVDTAAKRLKRREPVQRQRKNPRQKRARSNAAKASTASVRMSRIDAKPVAKAKRNVAPHFIGLQTSSESVIDRDDEWTIDDVFGTPEE